MNINRGQQAFAGRRAAQREPRPGTADVRMTPARTPGDRRSMPHDNQPATAKDLFASGNALAASGDYHGALACYEQVRVVRPADPMVYNNIGAALTRLRRPEAAVIAYRRAIGIAPELHASRNN